MSQLVTEKSRIVCSIKRNKNINNMAAFLAMAAAQVVGGAITAISSASAARRAREDAARAQKELDALEANRQAIPNLSGQIQNQYANLQVATQSAKFQAEESDISLANTLDTLRATGMGAGGATALAQAALRSKRDIGQSIEKQEAANAQLRAGGAASAQQQRIAQQNFEFGAREAREVAKLDRVANQLDQARAAEAANKQAMWSGISSAIGAAAGTAAGFASGEVKFGGGNSGTTSGVVTETAVDPNAPTNQQVINNLQSKKIPSSAQTGMPGGNVRQIEFNQPTPNLSMASRISKSSDFADSFNPMPTVNYDFSGTGFRQMAIPGMSAMPASLFASGMTDYEPSFPGASGVQPGMYFTNDYYRSSPVILNKY
jgi:hypothetical protein